MQLDANFGGRAGTTSARARRCTRTLVGLSSSELGLAGLDSPCAESSYRPRFATSKETVNRGPTSTLSRFDRVWRKVLLLEEASPALPVPLSKGRVCHHSLQKDSCLQVGVHRFRSHYLIDRLPPDTLNTTALYRPRPSKSVRPFRYCTCASEFDSCSRLQVVGLRRRCIRGTSPLRRQPFPRSVYARRTRTSTSGLPKKSPPKWSVTPLVPPLSFP